MKLFVYIFLLWIPLISFGQEIWTIEDCIEYAIEQNIDLRKADINVLDAKVTTKLSEQNLLPYLSAGAKSTFGFGRSIDPTSNDFINSNLLSTDVGLSSEVILYKGGVLKNEIRHSKIQEDILQADKDVILSRLILEIITVYFNALLTNDNYSNIESQLASLKGQIQSFEKLVSEGSRAKFELIELDAQRANIERRLLFAEHDIIRVMINLKQLLNLDEDREIELVLPDLLTDKTELNSLTQETLMERVIHTLPEINLYELMLSQGEINMRIAEGLKKPIVSLRGRLNSNFSTEANRVVSTTSVLEESLVLINGNRATFGEVNQMPGRVAHIPFNEQFRNNLSFGLNLNVAIPIIDNYKSRAAREQAKLQLELIKVDKAQWVRALKSQMSQYLNKTHESIRNLKASEEILSIRKLATQNAIKRFELGAISSYDFIDVQEELGMAEIDYIIAKYELMKNIQILEFYQGNIYQNRLQ